MATSESRILSVLFIKHQVYDEEESCKKEIAASAKVSMTTFAPLVSRMKKKGLIESGSGGGRIKLTKQGMDLAATVADPKDMVTTNEEVHEQIKQELKGKARKIFVYIADGEEYEKTDVMDAVDCTNPNTFGPLLSRDLKKPGYIEYPSKTTIRLTAKCFPFEKKNSD